MKFRTTFAVLIFTTCTTLSGADNQTESFRVPDPEEIYEAFQEGFIDYRDYQELLEISRSEFLSPIDSVYLMQFPDLLAGFSSNPLFEADDVVELAAPQIEKRVTVRRQSLLFRQYNRFNRLSQRKRLYRMRGTYGRWAYNGEVENGYSGSQRWSRRYVNYGFAIGSVTDCLLTIGNFKEQFGMGLIYGYHGQLLSKSSERSEIEQLTYPHYGGGNGVLFTAGMAAGQVKILYDTDRNEDFEKKLIGLSLPILKSSIELQLSCIYGRLTNRKTGAMEATSGISAYGHLEKKGVKAGWNLAVAEAGGRFPAAGAMKISWKRRQVRLNIDGWTYYRHYPTYFSGGPSSRRSHTLYHDQLDLSYSDRYSGESGIIVRTSCPLSGRMRFHSAVAYAWREFDDDRIEARIGVKNRLSGDYAAKINCYWRSDRLYSNAREHRRVQLEIIRYGTIIKTRLVMGHRIETNNDRDDFLVMAESRLSNRWGTLVLLCKFDQLQPDDLKNRYLYMTGSYDTELGRSLRSSLKYTYRYRRGEPGNCYGTIRLDLKWVIQ